MTSWLEIPDDSDFSLDNLPYGVASFKYPHSSGLGRSAASTFCVTAVGEYVVDLSVLQDAGAFEESVPSLNPTTFSQPTLNTFISHPPQVWPQVRQRLRMLFDSDEAWLRDNEALREVCIFHGSEVQMHLPIEVGEYTDFYSSREHATNVGIMFRGKDNALQPNWLHLPVGYHGRASTVVVSGTDIRRPCGQLQKDKDDPNQGSVFGPCRLLDFELEVASVVGGPPNDMGRALTLCEAKDRIFGYLLMNDWSARDIQKWEYVPLGPFTAKNFGTTLSPWIVTSQALEVYIGTTSAGPHQLDPCPLHYLQDPSYSSYDIKLQVSIQPEGTADAHTVCTSNFLNLYWNAAQQLVHHSVTGCVINPGDILGSGTISGQADDSFGSMLELSWKGTREVRVGDQVRKFLKDGDTVIMKGWSTKPGVGRVGFGECTGKVLPAKLLSEGGGSTLLENRPIIPSSETSTPQYHSFKLHSYWRSSSSWRVRIALNAKNLPFEIATVDLKAGGQKEASFLSKNPLGQVPVLEYTDAASGQVHYMTQSVAICEFLDAILPSTKPLFPIDPLERVAAMEMVEIINSGIQPLQNAPMVKDLERVSDGKIVGNDFAKKHIEQGLRMLEQVVAKRRTARVAASPATSSPSARSRLSSQRLPYYCLGNFSPTIVDVFLIPQLYNARRFGLNVEREFPVLCQVETLCSEHPWFLSAHANQQEGAEE